MLRFIQSFFRKFRKAPRPPALCTKIQGAELQVGMVVSLHDRPWFDHAMGRIHLLNYHGTRDSKLLGDTGAVEVTVYLETSEGRDIGFFRVYWDEDVWIAPKMVIPGELNVYKDLIDFCDGEINKAFQPPNIKIP